MLWTAAWSTAFDWLEAHHCRRSADQRPLPLRIRHAATLAGGLALTLAYSGYALLFNLAYDRTFPVHSALTETPPSAHLKT